jgi:hypothetical protein
MMDGTPSLPDAMFDDYQLELLATDHEDLKLLTDKFALVSFFFRKLFSRT